MARAPKKKHTFNARARTAQQAGVELLKMVTPGQGLYIKDCAAQIDTAKALALIAAGASTETTDKRGGTPLLYAALVGHAKIVKALIAAGADVDAQDASQSTPLIRTSFWNHKGKKEIIKALLDAGANPLLKDDGGYTAYDYANESCTGPNDPIPDLIRAAEERYRRNTGMTAKKEIEKHIADGLPLCRAIKAPPPIRLKPSARNKTP